MDQFFLTINAWMAGGILLASIGCFLWGIVSVLFSPCHLASIPLIVAYVGGQNEIVSGRQAALYAMLFSTGLFITITITGVLCSLLGRMLGDVGPYWAMGVGVILIWVALDMWGWVKYSIGNISLNRLQVRGVTGALILGLAYGVLSGTCTFGFIAPILAIITIQEKILTGVLLIMLFATGHCLPIAIAGCSAATAQKFLSSSYFTTASIWTKRLAGGIVGGLGIYFIARPWLTF
jgi:cytochrome c-type biogenesis protein